MMTMSTMIQVAEALRSMNNLLPGLLSAPTAVVEIQMMVMAVKQLLLRYLDDDILLVESYDVADVVDDELMMKVKE